MATVVDMHRASNSKQIATVRDEPSTATTSEREQIAMSLANDRGVQNNCVLLHLIRVLALYLYVFVAQHPLVADDVLLHDNASRLAMHASALEHDLHTALLALVETEVASNQFDGVVHEARAFSAIRRHFRMQRVKATTQCAALAALLATYLALLDAPIVHCGPFSMVLSTLEYVARSRSAKDVALPLLYPIVNAIDSLRIEQRECLDALTTLWKQLAARDPTNALLATIVRQHHAAIIEIASTEPDASARDSDDAKRADLGACFVTTLLQHADHIFRRDPESVDLAVVAPIESDTDDDEPIDDDDVVVAAHTLDVLAVAADSVAVPEFAAATATKPMPTLPRLTAAEVEVATPSPRRQRKPQPQPQPQSSEPKGLSKSMRRRKKKADDKQQQLAVGSSTITSTVAAVKQQQLLLQRKEQVIAATDSVLEAPVAAAVATTDATATPQSLPTAICVGIAAAAGTIAAALCVIFT